ncbi:MAG: hypothetical protein KIT56_01835 [Gammaproteobacteria bacterium]|nr:hypothetical protein [Gammaproteobacteria bacterium]MCW5582625.1 hypothetical protein [Gammaproteobacteria bacterium]
MHNEAAVFDWLNVIAILLSPLIALQVQKILDNLSNNKRRKEEIFNIIMETRAQPLSFEHVRALNKIDIAFCKDKDVTRSWNTYRDHLNSYPKEAGEAEQKIWVDKIPEKLARLLSAMSKLLGYDFEETLLIKGAYIPVAPIPELAPVIITNDLFIMIFPCDN